MIKPIVQLGNPVLHVIAKTLTKDEIVSQEIQGIIQIMKNTMLAAPGVGLAAPQIGLPLQIAVIEDRENYFAAMRPEIREERGRRAVNFHVIINPVLTVIDETKQYFFEGCLSVKDCMRITPRNKSVKVDCLNEKGEAVTLIAEGWYARILQHEIDHLHGKLYVDFADERVQIESNDENRKKWLNASKDEIFQYFNEKTQASK